MDSLRPVLDTYDPIIRKALETVLATRNRTGAQLKVLLIHTLIAARVDAFAYFRAYPKFSDFLKRFDDLVEVVSKPGGGDITVGLRNKGSKTQEDRPIESERLRGDVWRAFTNPDPRRRRFLHRTTGRVHHYADPAVTLNDRIWSERIQREPDHVEIQPATAVQQSQWMQAFVDSSLDLPDDIKRTARHLASAPYETALELSFERTLGNRSNDWRRYRAERIANLVESWAAANGILMSSLVDNHDYAGGTTRPEASGPLMSAPAIQPLDSIRSILSSCTDEELSTVLLPASVVLRLLRVQR